MGKFIQCIKILITVGYIASLVPASAYAGKDPIAWALAADMQDIPSFFKLLESPWNCPDLLPLQAPVIVDCKTYDSFYQNINEVGRGEHGIVYSLKVGEVPMVMKELGGYDLESGRQLIEQELALSRTAASAEVGPAILGDYICRDRYGNIIKRILMEKLDRSFHSELLGILQSSKQNFEKRTQAFSLVKSAQDAITKLHSLGIIHNDLHFNNLMVTPMLPDGRQKLKLIDFGSAEFVGERDSRKEIEIQAFYSSLEELFKSFCRQGCEQAAVQWASCQVENQCSEKFENLLQIAYPDP